MSKSVSKIKKVPSQPDKHKSTSIKTDNEEEGEIDSESDTKKSELSNINTKKRPFSSISAKQLDLSSKSKHQAKSVTESEDSEDGQASSSSNSDTSSNEDEDDHDEIKINKLKKLSEKLKLELKNCQHKFEKIERALLKAKSEDNKINIKKCKKYKIKYEHKIDKLKRKQDLARLKLVKLRSKQDTKVLIQTEVKSSAPIRLPFPVLNDKRDMKTILGTLESKLSELMLKRDANKKNIDLLNKTLGTCAKSNPNYEKHERNLEKLSHLNHALDSQRDKLIKQIDYIRLSLNLESLRSRGNMLNDAPLISKMAQQLNEMYNYMKNENKVYLKSQQKQDGDPGASKASDSQSLSVSTKPGVQPPPAPVSPASKLNSLYEQTNKALVALLAHTAATAHSAAAISAYNYSYYNYQQGKAEKKPGEAGGEDEEVKLVVPLKTEIEKASSTFAKYRDKISNFFINTKKLEDVLKEKSENKILDIESTGLNKLIVDYSENEGESSAEEEVMEVKVDPEVRRTVLRDTEEVDESDDEDEDGLVSDIANLDDIEIITTSELKSNLYKNINYLLPSLKASYFPLKASLDYFDINKVNATPEELIAVEKSKCALTFLGTPSKISGGIGQKRVKLADILFG